MHTEKAPDLNSAPPRHLKTLGVAGLGLAGAAVAFGIVSRVHADQRVANWTNAQAIPTVSVIDAKGQAAGSLVLPGDVEAFHQAPIHARVSGYLKRWWADIGAPVKTGQLIAEIDTPDLDQQLAQAKADLATAAANQQLAQTTAHRWAQLLSKDAVSRQDADTKNSDLQAKTAIVNAAKANVERLEAMEGFKRITAPFDGVVTTRSTDVGALITVGGVTDTPLFTIADQHRMRIYVQVPQAYTSAIKPGMTATFTVPEYPGRTFNATLVATSQAVTTQSGAQQVELQLDNADRALKSGEYAQVKFNLPTQANATEVPATALMFRQQGMVVAVLRPDGRVAIRRVTVSNDLGSAVEISNGLQPSDRIIDNPPDVLRDGDLVRVATADRVGGPANASR